MNREQIVESKKKITNMIRIAEMENLKSPSILLRASRVFFNKTWPLRKLIDYYQYSKQTHRLARATRKENAPLRIIVGAGGFRQESWLSTDVKALNLLNEKSWQRWFNHSSIDAILAEHVWEHLTYREGRYAADLVYHYLRAGGKLRVAVPDKNHPSPEYIESVRPGGSGPGADDHKSFYNYKEFQELFAKSGFEIHPLEYFDGNGNFQYSIWDPRDGLVRRSLRFDPRNRSGLPSYTSIIIDCIKPKEST